MRKPVGKLKNKSSVRMLRRRLGIRKKVSGTAERPRLVVNKSSKHLRIQVIDDVAGKTILSVQTFGKNKVDAASNKDGAKAVGAKVAEGLKASKISTVVFDRGGNKYHGVIAALADSVRENGIQI